MKKTEYKNSSAVPLNAPSRAADDTLSLRENKRRKIKTFVKVGASAASIILLIVFGTIAWFTMNREVESTGMQVTAAGTTFELKTTGYYGYYDDYLPSDVSKVAANRSVAQQPPSGTVSSLTTEGSTCIQWLIGSDYHANNYITSTTQSIDKGIRPGSEGELKFWIVPKEQGTVSVSFSLEMTPYRTNYVLDGLSNYTFLPGSDDPVESTPISIENDNNYTAVCTYLSNHLLFFKKRTTVTPQTGSSYYTYSDLISLNSPFNLVYDSTQNRYVGELTFEVQNGSMQDKEFSIFWVWPETLAEAVLPEAKQNPGCHAICTGTEVFNRLKESPTSFLKDYTAADTGNVSVLTQDEIAQYYSKLSVEYNNADQEIGDEIGYIMLTLNAIG